MVKNNRLEGGKRTDSGCYEMIPFDNATNLALPRSSGSCCLSASCLVFVSIADTTLDDNAGYKQIFMSLIT